MFKDNLEDSASISSVISDGSKRSNLFNQDTLGQLVGRPDESSRGDYAKSDIIYSYDLE